MPITLGGNDPDGDSLAYVLVAPPQHGLLIGAAPTLTYVPSALSKSDRLVAVCLAWHMDKAGKSEVQLGLKALMTETGVGRSLVMAAIFGLCGPVEAGPTPWRGLFTRKKRGLGRTNLYTLNTRVDTGRKR